MFLKLAFSSFGMNYYDAIAQGYDLLHREEQETKWNLVKHHFKLIDFVLDVGCGSGIILEKLPKTAIGIEPSEALAAQARKTHHTVLIGTAEQLLFPNKSFDVVVCMTVLHLTQYEKALAEIKRVGRKTFILSVLRKAKNAKEIIKEIKKQFSVHEEIKTQHDVIYVCKSKMTGSFK